MDSAATDPSCNARAITTGSDLRVEWWMPSNVIVPNVTVTIPELPPGRYVIPDGWSG